MTVQEMIDEIALCVVIELDDGTLPNELCIELVKITERIEGGSQVSQLTQEQLNMPWEKFLEEIERRGATH